MKKIIFFILFSGIIVSSSAQFKMSDASRRVATTMAVIENMYVDEINENKLAEDAIKSLLEKLDPHSSYISADEVKEMNEPLEGNFDGIGISFNMMADTLYVIETISGGPSEKVGILAGDRIVSVNDTTIAGVKMTTKNIMSRLRGPKGTIVNVEVRRRGTPKLLNFKITRAKIPIFSIDAAYMVDNSTAYIRLSRFGATTTQEFQDACKKLQKQGMTNLILDLEGNGGGYLSAAIDLADEFLSKNKLIVYTEGQHQPKQDVESTGKGLFEQGKLAILISEGSASASEVLSGAVQDWDRGLIIGRRSFGKGLVQRQIPLQDGAMLRLTVARYHTPTGRSIQRPYTNGDSQSYHMDVVERYNKGEMMSADSIHFPDSLKYQTLVNKRTVYGGGGIMPDYFVPIDTTHYSNYFYNLRAKGLINKVALNVVDNYRKDILKKYPKVESFRDSYAVSEKIFDELKAEAVTEKIEFKEEEYNRSKELIGMQIKALMARDLYDMEGFFKIINSDNEIFQKALEIIQNDERYNNLLKGNKDS